MDQDELNAELLRLVQDERPEAFFTFLKIEPRAGGAPIPFNDLTPEQEDMSERRLDYQDNVFLKSRNIGAGVHTQCFDFWFSWRHAWMGIPLNTLLEAHSEDTYRRHVRRVKDLNASLPPHLRLPVARDTMDAIEFSVPGTEMVTKFHGVTSDGKKGEGRGDTYHRVHFTEFAFYARGAAVLSSVTSAMHKSPYRAVTVESTPNGPVGDFPRLFESWQKDESGTRSAKFYSWIENPFHVAEIKGYLGPYQKNLDRVERELVDLHGASLPNIEWRRQKLIDTTLPEFQKNYPTTQEEAFSTSSAGYFGGTALRRVATVSRAREVEGWRVFAHPEAGINYGVAVDVGGGVGADDSVIQIINEHQEQVAVWSDSVTPPDMVGEMAWDVACRYNGALLLIEFNQIGMVATKRVEEIGGRVYHENGKPFHLFGSSSGGNKAQVFAHAKLMLDRERAKVNDPTTARQLLALRMEYTTTGHPVFRSVGKGKDDHAMAYVEALWVGQYIKSSAQARMNAMLRKTRTRRSGLDRFSHGVQR